MADYLKIISDSFTGYWNYLISEITTFAWHNYFWWLVGLSVLVWALELALPWRIEQKSIRRDFWLDGFYMFFNFFLFSLVGYNAISNVAVEAFGDLLGIVGITNLVAIEVSSWPILVQFALMFFIADFVQWNIHRLLHRVPWLWEFHKIHHSVKEMGFAAHLRFHWMETIVYKSIQYLPLGMIGFGIQDFFVLHIFTVAIGHLNHANVGWDYGPLKYFLNNPRMHIWHHAKDIPEDRKFGINFGISLSLWDYIFGTAWIPKPGRDIELGYEDVDKMPTGFIAQTIRPFQALFSRS
ncbi:MAG: sterol desaturase family protein [Flavobacteriales bacterium]|jgi:sterol desaturase/sphingolipid hydroxylase (fatty acid hydroxylase superfamily)|nr:sterol desaturase family protein [Flavobacteriales bacterium]MBT3963172.1 sterol desaturase family protein [Flavobacteriales bacterium]MBT4705648.1 sterol desaturase family protein [Flavobacteriales bacterium]MBT4930924.1 sterol desaturase family protein [Flavobacteriales bacterium]MBT5132738.1 sterol desaturase family protein [Flavobacteriales bacterium]